MFRLFWAWIPVLVLFIFSIIFGFIPVLLLRLLGLKSLARSLNVFTARYVSYAILNILNVHVTVTGEVKELKKLASEHKKVCYISNHTSILDIPLIEGPLSLGCGFILKDVLIFCPFINIVALALDCVFMNRKNLKKSVKSINRGVDKINKGTPMLIFPEGTRSKNGKIGAFKHGSFKLATKSEAIIVPIVIKGVRVGFEDRKKIFSRVNAQMYVGKAIQTSGLDRDGVIEMESMIERTMLDIYNNLN